MHLPPYLEAVHIQQPSRYFAFAQTCRVLLASQHHISATDPPSQLTQDARREDMQPGCGTTILRHRSRCPSDPSAAPSLRHCYIRRLTSWVEYPGVPHDSPMSFTCHHHLKTVVFSELLRDALTSQIDHFDAAGRCVLYLVLTAHGSAWHCSGPQN